MQDILSPTFGILIDMNRLSLLLVISFLINGLSCHAEPATRQAYKSPELSASVKAEIAKATQAIEAAPTAHNYCARGGIYGKNKHYAEALEDHNRAIQLDPSVAFYWAARGSDYSGLEKWDKGIADANKALSLCKKGDIVYIHSLRLRGHCYYQSGQQKLADADDAALRAVGSAP